jgi:hypothetical protein
LSRMCAERRGSMRSSVKLSTKSITTRGASIPAG